MTYLTSSFQGDVQRRGRSGSSRHLRANSRVDVATARHVPHVARRHGGRRRRRASRYRRVSGTVQAPSLELFRHWQRQRLWSCGSRR